MKKLLIINATALKEGGALTILQQCLYFLHKANIHAYVFIAPNLNLSIPKNSVISLIPIQIRSAWQRLLWDGLGLKKWLTNEKITSYVLFSLQNTAVRIHSQCEQFVYIHQALPFHAKKWSFLGKQERRLASYKYIYPVCMFLFSKKNTQYIVQTNWMKQALIKRTKLREQNVHIYRPTLLDIPDNQPKNLQKFSLFYPANQALYKNHLLIIQAMALLKKDHPTLEIHTYFTLNHHESMHIQSLVKQLHLTRYVHFVGTLNALEMAAYYRGCTGLLFPSYIESFGLPLLEAAQLAKPMVVLNEPYAWEVIGDYAGAIFADNHIDKWKQAILKLITSDYHLQPYKPCFDKSWKALFEHMNQFL